MLRAKKQSTREPTGICFSKKRSDGMSLIPWEIGRCLTCDVTIVTGGTWYLEGLGFVANLGSKISKVTGYPQETSQLHQRISLALQRGNALCFSSCFFVNDTDD